jgi:hypothetical protein
MFHACMGASIRYRLVRGAAVNPGWAQPRRDDYGLNAMSSKATDIAGIAQFFLTRALAFPNSTRISTQELPVTLNTGSAAAASAPVPWGLKIIDAQAKNVGLDAFSRLIQAVH